MEIFKAKIVSSDEMHDVSTVMTASIEDGKLVASSVKTTVNGELTNHVETKAIDDSTHKVTFILGEGGREQGSTRDAIYSLIDFCWLTEDSSPYEAVAENQEELDAMIEALSGLVSEEDMQDFRRITEEQRLTDALMGIIE